MGIKDLPQSWFNSCVALWHQTRKKLVLQMLAEGMETIIVSCNTTMGGRFLGQSLSTHLIEEREALGIDPCGEEGEFYTLAMNRKMFQAPFKVNITGRQLHNDYWFATLQLA